MASPSISPNVAAAYRHCWQLATTHYENFTVGSWLLPRRLRQHIAAIYAFARTADDFADEGDLSRTERLARLTEWERHLDGSYRGTPTNHPVFVALAHTIDAFELPPEPFRKLLAAFRRDVDFQPFATFEALRAYCRLSAEPVGHLILSLFGDRDPAHQLLADDLCSGLQLANFWQDVAVDAAKGRLYLPLADVERFGCRPDELTHGIENERTRVLMAFEVERARTLLHQGAPLARLVDRQLAREVRLFTWGGLSILRAIEAAEYDVFRHRPTLSPRAKARLVLRVLLGGATTRSQNDCKEAMPRRLESTDGQPHRGGRPTALADAYAYCQELTRRSSSNFYYAFRLLGPEKRKALHAVYAFCRFVDDIADEQGTAEPARLLTRWRDELDRAYSGRPTHPIGAALADAVHRFPLEQRHFVDLMRGVEMDLSRRRYARFDDLYQYCYSVASTVGLLCIEIFGYQQPSARDYAVDLGVAFQLTNILRDVMEDGRRGRIYLPLEDLRHFACTEEQLLSGRYSPHLGALMAFECGRARAYYLRARGALAPADRGSLAAAEAMRLIYERLLGRIEARHFDVFGAKVTLPRYEKLTLAMAAWGRSQLAALSW